MANNDACYKFVSGSIQLEEVEVKGVIQHFLTGYITTGTKDLVNDIVTDECQEDMLRQLKSGNIKVDVEHELWKKGSETKTPAGRIVEARKDEKGIWVKVHLNKNYPNFKTMLEQIQQKFFDAFSIAFRPVKFAMKEVEGMRTRLLKKIQLLNVAITGNPANPDCMLGAVATKSISDYEAFLKERNLETGEMDADLKKCKPKEKKEDEESDSSESLSDAEKEKIKKQKRKEEMKMPEEKPEEKPEGGEAPEGGETPPEETPEPGAEAEQKNLKTTVEALQKEVKELKEKGIEEKMVEIKNELLEMKEFKDVKEAEEAVEREEKIAALEAGMAEMQGIINAPALKGIQDAPPSETAATEELEKKANEDNGGAVDKSGPLDHIR